MKWYRALALLAFVALGGAAVWMGGLNQDEGWYLYAANMVSEGKVPYRDFFYTQGPLMPIVYSAFTWVWRSSGLLGARVFTFSLGALGIAFAVVLARRLVPAEKRPEVGLTVFFLLGSNLYHLYFLAIPKTYALAALFMLAAALAIVIGSGRKGRLADGCWVVGGLGLALSAGTRISLGAMLAVVGGWLLCTRQWRQLVPFAVGGFLGLMLVYGPFLVDGTARAGLIAAQRYHAARGGFDVTWTVGSLSRLVRWYLPIFIVLGLGTFRQARLLLAGFLSVFTVQMLAPFPYEDYQVPIMGLLAVFAAVNFTDRDRPFGTGETSDGCRNIRLLTVLGLCFASSFGSPLLEQWSTNGQDRFWSLKKPKTELALLREVAKTVEALDPGGKELLTQDLYLAIETGRKVPRGLEMGPFSMLTDAEWRVLLGSAPCAIAALSGYSFAIEPPVCNERPVSQQLEYWTLLKRGYNIVDKVESFGQNATPLLVLKRK